MSVWLVAREQAKALVLHWPARHAKQVWLLSPTDLFRIKECMGQNQVAGFFYRMRSKGSRFTLGVWGWGCVRLTSRLRPQPFATVRNRPREGRMLLASPSFRVAGVALFVTIQHVSIMFHNVSKVVRVASFSEDALRFSWQAQHCGDLHDHFAWQAQSFKRVVLRVFCKSQCQGCIKWWQKCKFRGRRFVTENCRRPRTKHRFWCGRVVGFMRKLVGKRGIWSNKVWKIENVSHETLVFRLQHVSSRFSGFLVAPPCLWAMLQNLSFIACFPSRF